MRRNVIKIYAQEFGMEQLNLSLQAAYFINNTALLLRTPVWEELINLFFYLSRNLFIFEAPFPNAAKGKAPILEFSCPVDHRIDITGTMIIPQQVLKRAGSDS